jgi:mono/diheme cytochrome c family protein
MKLRLAIAATFVVATATTFALAAQQVKSQWDGIYTEEQAKRGELVYGRKCVSCHGSDLMGSSEHAPALVGSGFTPDWDNMSLADLFERIRTTMPQDDVGGLSQRQTADVLAFMFSKGGYPSGTVELPGQAEGIQEYKFLTVKPGK